MFSTKLLWYIQKCNTHTHPCARTHTDTGAYQLHFLRFVHVRTTSTSTFSATPIWSRSRWEKTLKLCYIYFRSPNKKFQQYMRSVTRANPIKPTPNKQTENKAKDQKNNANQLKTQENIVLHSEKEKVNRKCETKVEWLHKLL